MPRIYKPVPELPSEIGRALNVFNANTLRAAVIRDMAQHPAGDTTGNMARRIGVDYRQVYQHIKVLEAEGLVRPSGDAEVRSGQRVNYELDSEELRSQAATYLRFLSGE